MRVVYIATELPKAKLKKLSKKEEIRQLAMCLLAKRRIHDEERAKKMFAPEFVEIELLKQKLKK